uniref:Uncharacterized protein n=1 Tax=Arundo donax TaxID=35708 RepID=A0A0A9GLJ2_ARUDO
MENYLVNEKQSLLSLTCKNDHYMLIL